jgi:alkylation response protein AidB-like acyl-CoA dehydrogenase
VLEGAFWGTVASEPGSGGDVSRTKVEARLGPDGRYLLSGRKHFGSGSGMTSFMVTSAIPEGETKPATFFMDVRGAPWDGSAGIKLTQAWDGHGMAATQSHAFELSDFPAFRSKRPEAPLSAFFNCACAAVILGVVEAALAAAKEQLGERKDALRSYEKVEWANAEMEGWLMARAYEGMLAAIERADAATRLEVLQGKTAIAQLSEAAMTRVCRTVGGGAYSRQAPYGDWFEDVRALGFLRPPWGLAYDNLYEASWT